MSHIRMCHVTQHTVCSVCRPNRTNIDESCHTREWFMARIELSNIAHLEKSYDTLVCRPNGKYIDESCHACECIHGTHRTVSCRTYEGVMLHDSVQIQWRSMMRTEMHLSRCMRRLLRSTAGELRVSHEQAMNESRMSHEWVTSESRVNTEWVTNELRVGPEWVWKCMGRLSRSMAGESRMSHEWVTNDSRMSHEWVAKKSWMCRSARITTWNWNYNAIFYQSCHADAFIVWRVHACVCVTWIYEYVYVYIYKHIYTYAYTCPHTFACMYILQYIRMHMFTHAYT